MAYETIDALPEEIRGTLPEPAQKIYMTAFNSASSDGMNEENARDVAWNSVKNIFVQRENGEWQYKAENWSHENPAGTMPQS
jgi:cation transport regulator